jgi:hypothetical protein
MSVAIANQGQSQEISLDDPSKNPILKGKHVKDGKEILAEVVKDTAEAKAKIAEHLSKLMTDLKAAGTPGPLQNLSKNPAWQNWISSDLEPMHVSTKSDEINMYMEIFKALALSGKAANIDLASTCKKILTDNGMTKVLELNNEDSLKTMQATFAKNNQAYEDAQHQSFWDKLIGIVVAVCIAVVAVCVTALTAGAAAPVSALGVGLAYAAIIGAGVGAGVGAGLTIPKALEAFDTEKKNNATQGNTTAATDMSTKITINSNAMQVAQNTMQADSQQEENVEQNKETFLSVQRNIVNAMAKAAASI